MRSLVVSGMALIAATYGLARFGYGLFLPRFTESFSLDSVASGLIQAGSFLAYCLAAAIASFMGTRPRRLVVWAGASAAAGSAGVAASPNAVVFACSVVVAGAGGGFATPGLVTMIERNLAPVRQERAQTVVNAGTDVGIVVAGLLMLLTVGQWRVGWAVIAAAVVLATVAVLRSDRFDRGDEVVNTSSGREPYLAGLAWPIAAGVLAGASSAAIWTFGRTAMDASRTGAETYSILAWMTLGAFGVLGAGAGRIVQASSLRTAWTSTVLAMAAATVVMGVAPGVPIAAYVSAAVFGASYTALSGVLIVWAVRLVPGRAAEGTAALFIALAVGQSAGSAVLGILFDASSPAAAFVVAGVLGISAIVPAMKRAAVVPLAVSTRKGHVGQLR